MLLASNVQRYGVHRHACSSSGTSRPSVLKLSLRASAPVATCYRSRGAQESHAHAGTINQKHTPSHISGNAQSNSKQTRTVTTAAFGRQSSDSSPSTISPPPSLTVLVIINFLVFTAAVFGQSAPAKSLAILGQGAPFWWQFITSAFVHANWQQLVTYQMLLLLWGGVLQPVLSGPGLLAVYMSGAVGANLLAWGTLAAKAKTCSMMLGVGSTGGLIAIMIAAVLTTGRMTVSWILGLAVAGYASLLLMAGFTPLNGLLGAGQNGLVLLRFPYGVFAGTPAMYMPDTVRHLLESGEHMASDLMHAPYVRWIVGGVLAVALLLKILDKTLPPDEDRPVSPIVRS